MKHPEQHLSGPHLLILWVLLMLAFTDLAHVLGWL